MILLRTISYVVPFGLIVLELVLNGMVCSSFFTFLLALFVLTSPLWIPLLIIWWPVLVIVKLLHKYTSINSYTWALFMHVAYYMLYNY